MHSRLISRGARVARSPGSRADLTARRALHYAGVTCATTRAMNSAGRGIHRRSRAPPRRIFTPRRGRRGRLGDDARVRRVGLDPTRGDGPETRARRCGCERSGKRQRLATAAARRGRRGCWAIRRADSGGELSNRRERDAGRRRRDGGGRYDGGGRARSCFRSCARVRGRTGGARECRRRASSPRRLRGIYRISAAPP